MPCEWKALAGGMYTGMLFFEYEANTESSLNPAFFTLSFHLYEELYHEYYESS